MKMIKSQYFYKWKVNLHKAYINPLSASVALIFLYEGNTGI